MTIDFSELEVKLVKNKGYIAWKFESKHPSSKPLAVGAMTREELDAELQKGVDSIKAGRVYSTDEVDAVFSKES